MKKNEELTLAEVAAYLGWTPRFVERLAVGGKLPGREVDGIWRFKRSDLVDWLDQKIQTLDLAQVADLEHRFESELEKEGLLPRPHPAPLATRLTKTGVDLHLEATQKADVLKGIVNLAAKAGLLADPALLLSSLVEREALCSTALPGGVAIVHPRRPLPAAIRGPVLVFARTTEPVEFGAPDGERTQLFILIATLDEREHLHALARLVRVLQGGGLEALRKAESPEALIAVLRGRELEIDTARGPVSKG